MSQSRWKQHGASRQNRRHETSRSPHRVSSSPIRYRSKSPEEIRLPRERFGDMSPGASNPPMENTSRSSNVRPQSHTTRQKEITPPPRHYGLIPHHEPTKFLCYPPDTLFPAIFI